MHGEKVRFGQRGLVISRRHTGYLALYRYLPHTDRVPVLALRHQREAGDKRLQGGVAALDGDACIPAGFRDTFMHKQVKTIAKNVSCYRLITLR